MAALSLPVPRGVPGLSSPQVLAVDFSETEFLRFGGQKATGEALAVLVETRLDCSGVPLVYFVRSRRTALCCVSRTLQLWNSRRAAPRGLRGPPPPTRSPGPRAARRSRGRRHSRNCSRRAALLRNKAATRVARILKPRIGLGARGA